MLEFWDQWISWVGTGALVIESLFSEVVEGSEVVFLLWSVSEVLDEWADAAGLHEVEAFLAEDFLLFFVSLTLFGEAAVFGDFCVSSEGAWILVLWEAALLGWGVGGVESDDWDEADGVGETVWDVELLAELVGDGVGDTEEGVGEGHASEGSGVVHGFAGLLGLLVDGLGEILEDELDGLEGDWLGELGGEHGDIGLNGVGEGVDAGPASEEGWHGHGEGRVDDGHLWGEHVVGEWVLDLQLFVGDDGEWGDFRASTRGGWDADGVGLALLHVEELWEFVDTLTDIHETLGEAGEVDLVVLVLETNHLHQIHGGTTTEGDEQVWLEGVDQGEALVAASKVRVWGDVEEDGALDAVGLEWLDDPVSVAEVEQHLVGDEEASLEDIQLLEGLLEAPVLEVHLGWGLEPEAVLSLDDHLLVVQQVLDTDVLGDGVTAVGTATNGEGWVEGEVVEVTDTAVGGWLVDDQTTGLNGVGEFVDSVLGLEGGVDGSGVTLTSEVDGGLGDLESLVEVLGTEHTENWGKLLQTHSIGVGDESPVGFADEDLAWVVSWDGKTSLLADFTSWATDGVWIHLADAKLVEWEDEVTNLLGFFSVHDVATTVGELSLNLLINSVNDDARLLRSADNTVIESLGHDDGGNSVLNVTELINDGAVVTRADTEGWLTRRIGGVNHCRATSGEDAGSKLVLHQLTREINGWDSDPTNAVGWGTSSDGSITNNAGSFDGRLSSSWMW